jgi:hypothetical protein
MMVRALKLRKTLQPADQILWVWASRRTPRVARPLRADPGTRPSRTASCWKITSPGDLEAQIEAFVADYNHRRYHESIDNLTPADVYFGRGPTILAQRERIKRQTIANRRLQHQLQAA